ncbi:hypothetical protein [Kitasatospora sp. P5_F3]
MRSDQTGETTAAGPDRRKRLMDVNAPWFRAATPAEALAEREV